MPEIKLTTLKGAKENSLPVVISSVTDKCDVSTLTAVADAVSKLYNVTPLQCKVTATSTQSLWRAEIPIVRHGMENVLPSLDASIYYSSRNSVIMLFNRNFVRDARRLYTSLSGKSLDPSDIEIEFKFVNDTDEDVTMAVAGVWVNGMPVGRETQVVKIPERSYVTIKLSDISITVLGLDGVEAIAVFPAIVDDPP